MEDEDQSSKTEEPTDRKLRKAREQGNVPKSKEVNNLFMLAAMLGAIMMSLPAAFEQILNLYGGILSDAGGWRANSGSAAGGILGEVLGDALMIMLPTFLLFVVVALAGGFVQTGFLFSSHPIQPKLNKISLLQGFKRTFSLKTVVEFLKTLFKMVVVGTVIYFVLFGYKEEFAILPDESLLSVGALVQDVMIRILLAAMAIMFLLGVVDFLFQKNRHAHDLRMSRREIKDEMKETEGDPHIKGRQRQIRMERARMRMMQAVPEADVVITNPTHYSVALQYENEGERAAPLVVAKGVDHLAMRIREIANENDVPLYEDPPLARQLYADVEVGEEIPVSLYEATAKVIAFVLKLKK